MLMRASRVLLKFFFFKQKTAYEMRISDWSSDVCSSDLFQLLRVERRAEQVAVLGNDRPLETPGGASERLDRAARGIDRNHVGACRQRQRKSRSAERRVGQACASTCRSRWSTYH